MFGLNPKNGLEFLKENKPVNPEDLDTGNMTDREMHASIRAQIMWETFGTPEKLEHLKELKGKIDLSKIPRIPCSSTEHDRAMVAGMYFVASNELAQISHVLKELESDSQGVKLRLKDGKLLTVPTDCEFFQDTLSGAVYYPYDEKKLADEPDDYLNLERARLYMYIGENPRLLERFTKNSGDKADDSLSE